MECCENCGGRLDRPGLYDCDEGHPKPTKAQRIVQAIEDDLNDRRGMKLSQLDDDTQQEIRDVWTVSIDRILNTSKGGDAE